MARHQFPLLGPEGVGFLSEVARLCLAQQTPDANEQPLLLPRTHVRRPRSDIAKITKGENVPDSGECGDCRRQITLPA
jgi:hypothetical protein